MKTIIYILTFLFVAMLCQAQEFVSVYRGAVYVKENKIEKKGSKLVLDLQFDLSGLSVGRYQTLALVPVICQGRDSLLLQPIILNGSNKQKMYKRTLAFKGKAVADEGAYVVLRNCPAVLSQFNYHQDIPVKDWMKGAKLVLKGEFRDYNDIPTQTYIDVLAEKLRF